MTTHDWLEREVLRLRDRLHDLANDITELRLADGTRGRELEQLSRGLADVDRRLQKYAEQVEAMSHKDDIAEAVAARIAIDTRRGAAARFTRWQVWGIRVGIAATMAAAIGELIRLVGALHG